MASIRTESGLVPLRWGKTRDKQTITVRDSKAAPKVIGSSWLHGSNRKTGLAPEDFSLYHKAVKQAMLVGSRQMDLKDLDDLQMAVRQAREKGYPETTQGVRRIQEEARKKIHDMELGKEPVPEPPQNLTAEAYHRRRGVEPKKSRVYKKGRKTGFDRQAWFLIESGKLKIYPSDRKGCKPKTVYELSGIHCIFQDERTYRRNDSSAPKGFTERLQVTIPDRKHGSLYLYSTGNQARSWERSIQMAKCSLADRNSLGNILTKVGSVLLVRGWTALFRYYRELVTLRTLVHRFKGKVTMMQLSKAMNKLQLTYRKKAEEEARKEEQQKWAASLLAEKLHRVQGVSVLRDPRSVRHDIVSAVQSKFRMYRQVKITDRQYPLGTAVQSRVQQAQTGKVVGACFKSMRSVEALTLILNKEMEKQFRSAESEMKGKLKTYSEVNLPAGQVNIRVSENFGMLSFVDVDSEMEHSHLSNAGWAQYVNIDQISSVVMHSERRMALRNKRYELTGSMAKGPWITINGPRICWCRHVRMDPEGRKEVVGAANPFGVPTALVQGAKVRWLRVSVVVKSASVVAEEGEINVQEEDSEADEHLEDGEPREQRKTYMVLHLLGRRFQSDPEPGESPCYFGIAGPRAAQGGTKVLEMEVPISDEGGLAALDDSEVGVDLVEWSPDPARHRTIWAGKLPLWKALSTPEALAQSGQQQLAKRLPEEPVVSMADIMRGGPRRTERLIRLVAPDEVSTGRQFAGAQVFLEFTARVHDSHEAKARCVSPELQGRGPITALYTSHRGAWFDPKLSERKRFFIDHVANFVELAISDLYFPPGMPQDTGNPVQYIVEARCCGTTTSTMPLHRPKASWKQLLTVDPFKIPFQGTKLFLPIQPGAWFSELPHQRPAVELRVLSRDQVEPVAVSFDDLLSGARKPVHAPDFTVVFHGRVVLDELVVDQPKENRRIGLNPVHELEASYNLASGESTVSDLGCEVMLSATLRDRDYVLLHTAAKGELGPSKGVVCIGDKATMLMEELLVYPQSATDFRHRMMVGEYDPQTATRRSAHTDAGVWLAPLREPCLSHEYWSSRLGSVSGQPPFKQSYVPRSAEDPIPHKYVLPQSEVDFLREGRPGSFWRVVEDMVAQRTQDMEQVSTSSRRTPAQAGKGQEPVVVSRLSHLVRHVVCTVLAVNSDGTCDAELSPSFVAEWERNPARQLAVPGQVVVKEFPVDPYSTAAFYSAPSGQGDISTLTRRRVILRGVSLQHLSSIQSTGFNVYDAALGTVEDALDVHPDEFCNDFNPCVIHKFGEAATSQGSRRGGYRLPAGPVPTDAGQTCKYEWSLHMQLADEENMYQFITNLRQTARLGLYEKQKSMDVYMRRVREMAKLPGYSVGKTLASGAGHLEVVVVECRHLRPPRVLRDKDWRETMTRMSEADINAIVRLKVRHGAEGSVTVKFKLNNLDYAKVTQSASQVAGLSGAMQDVIAYQLSEGIGQQHVEVELALVEGQMIAYVSLFLPDGVDANEVSKALVLQADPIAEELAKRIKTVSRIKDSAVGTISCEMAGKPHVEGDMLFKGNKVQTTIPVAGSSPSWASIADLESSGGWVFKLPDMDPMPEGKNKHMLFELEVVDQQTMGEKQVGLVRVPLFDKESKQSLCDENEPFSNKWFSLLRLDKQKMELVPSNTGDIHIMTMWVPDEPSAKLKTRPKTARGYLTYLHRQALLSREGMHEIRDPVYGVQVSPSGYNPNNFRDGFPERPCDELSRHMELMMDILPYLKCREQLSLAMWSDFLETAKLDHARPRKPKVRREGTEDSGAQLLEGEHPEEDEEEEHVEPATYSLGQLRRELVKSTRHQDKVWQLDGLLRRGVPSTKRAEVWMEILCADETRDAILSGMAPRAAHELLVEAQRPKRGDAMMQLAEDLVGASSWETSLQPRAQEAHMERLRRAHDVCIALVGFSQDSENLDEQVPNYRHDHLRASAHATSSGVAYCEALLVIAYHLLVAQVPEETTKQKQRHEKEKKAALTRHRTIKSAEDEAAEEQAEANAFWMLYALAGSAMNGAYRDYYGTPRPSTHKGEHGVVPIAGDSGIMSDVYRVGLLLARYDRDVYVHLDALGFHLATVFYGAFARLFAFSLPISTLFNFWDLLFSEAVHPSRSASKPARHSLIDLAFGVLSRVREDLLACESAVEARDCIVSFLESLYEPSAAVEIAAEAERFLWEGEGAVQDALSMLQATAQQAIAPLHVKQFNTEQEMWHSHFHQFRQQNIAMKSLVQDPKHSLLPEAAGPRGPIAGGSSMSGNNLANNTNALRSGAAAGDLRITTKNVKDRILPELTKLMMGEHASEGVYGGMLRPTPAKLRLLGPEVKQDLAGAMTSWIAWVSDSMGPVPKDLAKPVAVGLPPPEFTAGEPTHLDLAEFQRQVQRGLGPCWMDCVKGIWESFASPSEKRMSLNEFFIALVCCSKGTVGEKALTLFSLFGTTQPPLRKHHATPVTHSATLVSDRFDSGKAERSGFFSERPPVAEDVPRCVLHFKVFSRVAEKEHEMLLGEVYVTTLRPFISHAAALESEEVGEFPIWGEPSFETHGARPIIGYLKMVVEWTPVADQTPEVGQLTINLRELKFNERSIDAPEIRNPRVALFTYDDSGQSQHLKKAASRTTSAHAGGAAHAAHMEWPETMRWRRDTLQHIGRGDQGWDMHNKAWKWSQAIGRQQSEQGLTVRRDLVVKGGPTKTTISMKACRMITAGILQRSLQCVTNRQAALLADQIFSPAGAVPGILDAVLVVGESTRIHDQYHSIEHMREMLERQIKPTYIDVRHQLVKVHEQSISEQHGNINLFPAAGAEKTMNLKDLKVKDPFPGEHKSLWIRYCRAGDGQRINSLIDVDKNGGFKTKGVALDMELSTQAGKTQMLLSKDEFVSCIMGSPLLSEPLRQLSTSDNNVEGVPRGEPIALQVKVWDTTRDGDEDELFNHLSMRQGILLELWSHSDFLGECWLPAFSELSKDGRRFILDAGDAPPDEGGTSTRPDPRKRHAKDKCKGMLFVTASWTFPLADPDADPDGANANAGQLNMMSVGMLKLTIEKAEGLRLVGSHSDKEPKGVEVHVYRRNETLEGTDRTKHPKTLGLGGWLVSSGEHHQPIARTKAKDSRSPEWNETSEVKIPTGTFEVRSYHNSQHRQRGAASEEEQALKIYFGDDASPEDDRQAKRGGHADPKEGRRHNVKVYLGETIHQFKHKLKLACRNEAKACESGPYKDLKKAEIFRTVAADMSIEHTVLDFLPSAKLTKLYRTKASTNELSRVYWEEMADPSSWQPLDPVRTFGHYPTFGRVGPDGRKQTKNLRVIEGTEIQKLRNNRFRQFEAQRQKWRESTKMLNTDQKCFGYARYVHIQDGGNSEWRQAILDRPTDDAEGGRHYQVSFIHTPLSAWSGPSSRQRGSDGEDAGADRLPKEERDESGVLLAPLHPKIMGSSHVAHTEFLAQARQLHEDGMAVQDIADHLNGQMRNRWLRRQATSDSKGLQSPQAGTGSAASEQPPMITLADVEHSLKEARVHDAHTAHNSLTSRSRRMSVTSQGDAEVARGRSSASLEGGSRSSLG